MEIPESELFLSRQTLLDNPLGFETIVYGGLSLFIAGVYALFSHLLNTGEVIHTDFLILGRMAANAGETVIREPGIILLSTRALLISMPLMTGIFAVCATAGILAGKINNKQTCLFAFAFAFAFSFYAIILTVMQFEITVDSTGKVFSSGI